MRPRVPFLLSVFFVLAVYSARSFPPPQVATTATAQPLPSVRLSIAASKAYAKAKDVPLKSALLFTDTVHFEGKSGVVKLAKGQTTLYVLLSNMDASCDTMDTYDRTRFLRLNIPSIIPKLPRPAADEDFVGLFMTQQNFDPRKVQHPPLMELLTDPNRSSLAVGRIHFTGGLWELTHNSAGPKGYRIARTGSWVYQISPEHLLYLDVTKHKAPFDASMFTLIKTPNAWTANFDLNGDGFAISGNVSLQVCPANTVTKQ